MKDKVLFNGQGNRAPRNSTYKKWRSSVAEFPAVARDRRNESWCLGSGGLQDLDQVG